MGFMNGTVDPWVALEHLSRELSDGVLSGAVPSL